MYPTSRRYVPGTTEYCSRAGTNLNACKNPYWWGRAREQFCSRAGRELESCRVDRYGPRIDPDSPSQFPLITNGPIPNQVPSFGPQFPLITNGPIPNQNRLPIPILPDGSFGNPIPVPDFGNPVNFDIFPPTTWDNLTPENAHLAPAGISMAPPYSVLERFYRQGFVWVYIEPFYYHVPIWPEYYNLFVSHAAAA